MKRNDYVDLALECGACAGLGVKIVDMENYSLSEISVDSKERAELFGKLRGEYYTFLFLEASELTKDAADEISEAVAKRFGRLLPPLKNLKILVAGLGNGGIVFDSLGTRVCEKISPDITDRLRIFPYEVGVEGKSGIEALSVVKALVKATEADAVIVVDSLVARGEERLGRVLQITDAGISAASGVGRHKDPLTLDNVGVPVIAVGAPLALNVEGLLAVNEQVESSAEALSNIIANSISKIEPKTE